MFGDHRPKSKLHRFQIIDTDAPDEMRDVLVNVFGARYFDVHQGKQRFRATVNLARLKNLDVSFAEYSAAVHVTYPPDNLVRQQFPLRGSGQTTVGHLRIRLSPNETCVMPAGMDTAVDVGHNYAQLVLRINAAALHTKLAALVGAPIVRSIEFLPQHALENPELLRLRRLIDFLVNELDCERGPLSDLAVAEFEQHLLIAFLTGNAHNYSHLLEGQPLKAGPWQVRMAEEYIEANWNQPLTVEALAAATGASARSIFKTFKEARGYSPMVFVKSIRLRHARQLLQTPDPTTSVTGVGLFCGIQ